MKKVKPIKYKEPTKYPEVKKDLAFIVKKDIQSDEIERVIKKSAGKVLTNIDVFDIYTGENVLADEKSIAFSLTFSHPPLLFHLYIKQLLNFYIFQVLLVLFHHLFFLSHSLILNYIFLVDLIN